MGHIRVYRPATDDLAILVQKGFQKSFLDHFKTAKAFDASPCGRAFGIMNTIFINDVQEDVGFAKYLRVSKTSGFRAIKAVPIISKNQKCIGIISTYYSEPKWVWNTKKLNKIMPVLITALEQYVKTTEKI
jgi:hypothetical protein